MGFIMVVHKLASELARLLMIRKLTCNIDIGLLLGEQMHVNGQYINKGYWVVGKQIANT